MKEIDNDTVLSSIESTLLAPTASEEAICGLCQEAVEHGFHGVCVAPMWIDRAVRVLRGTGVSVITVNNFPFGNDRLSAVIQSADRSIQSGVLEIDTVLPLGKFRASRESAFIHLMTLRNITKGCVFKVILETCHLNRTEIIEASRLAIDAGADYLKTSTGYGSRGASVEDVHLMREMIDVGGRPVGIKVSGGIKELRDAMTFLGAGADRLGTSTAARIVSQLSGL